MQVIGAAEMSHQEQQEQEIEALEAIYSEEEIHVACRDYPDIELSIELKSNQVCFFVL